MRNSRNLDFVTKNDSKENVVKMKSQDFIIKSNLNC